MNLLRPPLILRPFISPIARSAISFACLGAIALATLSLSACVNLLPKPGPAPDLYRVDAPLLDKTGQHFNAIIVVTRPRAPRSLAGQDLLVRDKNGFAALAQASWVSPTEELMQDLLLDTLQRTDRFRAVLRPEQGAKANYEVQWRILRFEADMREGEGKAYFAASFTLLEYSGRNIALQKIVETEAPIRGKNREDIATALSHAARQGSETVSQQIFAFLEKSAT